MHKYAIIIDCPDEYLDILQIFFIFLNKNWKDRTSTIYVTTETKEIDCPKNVVFIKCGKGKNSIQRSKCALANIIDDYVMILIAMILFQKLLVIMKSTVY